MVAVGETVVKSSRTTPWLIDEMLDELVDHPKVIEASRGLERVESLAATVALGCCLGCPPAPRMSISRDALLDVEHNPVWTIALAALKAWDPRYDGDPDPDPGDREYRFLVVQSQVHRQLVDLACADLNPAHLVSFHSHLGRWFLRTQASPRLARVMRMLTVAGLSSLGLPLVGCRVGPAGQMVAGTSA
jgi:hypothetical protein